MSKSLIAFYSRADENYFNGAIRDIKVGNTEIVANKLKDITGSDIFKIDQVDPYSKNYNSCIAEAKDDQKKNARPELKVYPDSLEEYDTIYLLYPNYWGTMPMAVFTFLEHFDFSGKKIKPLCTNEGSGMGSSERDIAKLCPNSDLEKGLAIRGSNVNNADIALKKWVKEN
jgi:flavodoxin